MRSWLARQWWWPGWRVAAVRAFLLGGLGVAVVAAWLALRKEPVMFVDAQTRRLEYQVSNAETSAIRFDRPVTIRGPGASQESCTTGVLLPATGSALTFRVQNDLLIIVLQGPRTASPLSKFLPLDPTGTPIDLESGTRFVYGAAAHHLATGVVSMPECVLNGTAQPLRLPIWGPARLGRLATAATVGQHQGAAGEELLGGTVKVYGRALQGNEIYAAGSIDLPRGTRLDAGDGSSGAPWFGAAHYIAASDNAPAFLDVTASVQAAHLVLTREGAGEPFVHIDAGFAERLLGESTWVAVAFVIGGLALWVQIIDGWTKLWRRR